MKVNVMRDNILKVNVMKDNVMKDNVLDNDKNVYVIISQTNTWLGKMIRLFTSNEYNHVSIAIN